MTTKEKILAEIKDINYAYNDCSKYNTIKNLLDEMEEGREERKKGKWIKRGRMVQCSECGRFTTVQENYCPSCGSYNGEENENEKVK